MDPCLLSWLLTLLERLERQMGWTGMGDTLYNNSVALEGEQRTKRTHESRAVPDTLDDEGGLDQSKVTDRILLAGLRNADPCIDYENVRTADMPLSRLEQMWTRRNAAAALRVLFKKHRLIIDPHFLLKIPEGNVLVTWMGVSLLHQLPR